MTIYRVLTYRKYLMSLTCKQLLRPKRDPYDSQMTKMSVHPFTRFPVLADPQTDQHPPMLGFPLVGSLPFCWFCGAETFFGRQLFLPTPFAVLSGLTLFQMDLQIFVLFLIRDPLQTVEL